MKAAKKCVRSPAALSQTPNNMMPQILPLFWPTHLTTVAMFVLQVEAQRIGDKFGESLGGSQAPPSFWKVPGLPQKSPEVLSLWNLKQQSRGSPEVSQTSPEVRRTSPKFPGLCRRSAPFRSLTPFPDSQKNFSERSTVLKRRGRCNTEARLRRVLLTDL